jgi:hypothetical protein
MNRLERQLLAILDTLRDRPGPGICDRVRTDVLALRELSQGLDPDDGHDRAVRALYDYVDASTEAALADPAGWWAGERTAVENALARALAAGRRGGSVYAVSCLREELNRLERWIASLDPLQREPLRALLSYVHAKNREAMELAVRCDWGAGQVLRRPQINRAL